MTRRSAMFSVMVAALGWSVGHGRLHAATCTGATPCKACKNCSSCKHCAKEGGKCGVCRRASEAEQ